MHRRCPLSYHLLSCCVADEAGPVPRATHALHLYPCSSRREELRRKPGAASVPPARALPRRARDRAVNTQILTPWAPLAIENTEGVRWAGQACGGHRQGVNGAWGYHDVPPLLFLAALSSRLAPCGPLPRESVPQGGPWDTGAWGLTPRGVCAKRRHVPVPALPPLTLIHGKAHVECFELRALHEHLHALVSTHLLICGGESGMEEGTGASPSPPLSLPSMPAWMPSAHPMDMETSPALS